MNMEKLHAAVTARRAAAGLIAKDGIACATAAEKEYRDFRFEMKQREDWGNLPTVLHARLVALKEAAK